MGILRNFLDQASLELSINYRFNRYFSIGYIKIPVGRKYKMQHVFINEIFIPTIMYRPTIIQDS